MKFNFYTILIFLLLIVSLIFRMSRLEYPIIHTSKWGDGTRDYLVAHYIKQFGELPLVGPFNLLFESGFRDSPLYYYILAIFLMPYDNLMSLSLINIFFQVFMIALVYLVGKVAFGNPVGIVAALLFSFIPEVLRQSESIWQPNLMQPFSYLSLLLLILSYYKKSYKLLLSSLFMLTFAITLHNSSTPWVIPFTLITIYILKSQKKSLKFYLGAFLVSFLSTVIFRIPVLIYFMSNAKYINAYFGSPYFITSIKNYTDNLVYNFTQIMQSFSLNLITLLTLILLTIFYILTQNLKRKIIFFLGILFFLTPVVLSSFFNKNQLHYLILCFGIFTILVSEVVISFFSTLHFLKSRKLLKLTVEFILVLLMFKTFSSDFNFWIPETHPGEDGSLIKGSADAIQNEDLTPNSFQIISFASDKTTFRYPTLDTILMVPLEKKLNVKLGKISDDSPFNIVQTNDDKYIFVNCFEFSGNLTSRECIKNFTILYPKHSIVKPVFIRYPLSIYLAKRIS